MRILFITATRIGDAVISTGLLGYLVECYPQSKITIACGPLAQSLFAAVPGLERIIVLEKKPLGRHWFTLWNAVRMTKWDLVVDLRRSLISYLVPTKERARLGPDDRRSHRVELLSRLFSLRPPCSPKVWTTDAHLSAARTVLPDSKLPAIAVAPIAARPEKTWPQQNFIDLIGRVRASHSALAKCTILVVGAEDDRTALEQFASAYSGDNVRTLIGCQDLLTVFAVLSRVNLTLANDSGVAHLAATTGRPTVAMFGSTQPELYKPWGSRVSVAQAPSGHRQIEAVTVDAALAAVETVLN